MLLSGACELFGADEGVDLSFVSFSAFMRVTSVVGHPPATAIETGAGRLDADGDVLANEDNLQHVLAALPGWTASPATLHLLADSSRLPALEWMGPGGLHARRFLPLHDLRNRSDAPTYEVHARFVSGGEVSEIEGASRTLLQEVQRAALTGRVAATFANKTPVSFCDASSETETLWDIGIETLEAHRNQGYAALAVAYMIDQMGRRGKRPVWGAEESNIPSMRLANKLGFRAVDRLYVLYPPT